MLLAIADLDVELFVFDDGDELHLEELFYCCLFSSISFSKVILSSVEQRVPSRVVAMLFLSTLSFQTAKNVNRWTMKRLIVPLFSTPANDDEGRTEGRTLANTTNDYNTSQEVNYFFQPWSSVNA